jgi:hypothetical protein
MLSGDSSWTTSSWMLMNMVLSSNVRTASLVGFSLGFSHIQPTIQKSRYHALTLSLILTVFSRILLASIKFLGQCPCPRCLVKKADVPKMGMKSDLRRQDKLQCIDDHS